MYNLKHFLDLLAIHTKEEWLVMRSEINIHRNTCKTFNTKVAISEIMSHYVGLSDRGCVKLYLIVFIISLFFISYSILCWTGFTKQVS